MRTEDKYILVGHTPVPCHDLREWARCFGSADRHVAQTNLPWCWVSTVFLGLDHNHARLMYRDSLPILFETMAFWEGNGFEMWRCSTWDQAEKQHQEAVREVSRLPVIFGHAWERVCEQVRDAFAELRELATD